MNIHNHELTKLIVGEREYRFKSIEELCYLMISDAIILLENTYFNHQMDFYDEQEAEKQLLLALFKGFSDPDYPDDEDHSIFVGWLDIMKNLIVK